MLKASDRHARHGYRSWTRSHRTKHRFGRSGLSAKRQEPDRSAKARPFFNRCFCGTFSPSIGPPNPFNALVIIRKQTLSADRAACLTRRSRSRSTADMNLEPDKSNSGNMACAKVPSSASIKLLRTMSSKLPCGDRFGQKFRKPEDQLQRGLEPRSPDRFSLLSKAFS